MNTVKLPTSQEELMPKIETLLFGTNTERSINNGILHTQMNGRENLERETSMKDSDFMSKETSTLFPNSQTKDTSI